MPWVSGKCLTRLRTWRIGSPRSTCASRAATASSSFAASTVVTSETLGVASAVSVASADLVTSTALSFFSVSAMDRLLPEVARTAAARQCGAVLLGDRGQRRDLGGADVRSEEHT